MSNNGKKPRGSIAVSESTLQKAAARLSPSSTRLVSTEIHYLQRVLGTTASQTDIDQNVVAVRKLPWASIVQPE